MGSSKRKDDHDAQEPTSRQRTRTPLLATRRLIALTAALALASGLAAGAGGAALIRNLGSGSSSPNGTTGPGGMNGTIGGANTMQYDYSGSYSATLTADGSDETSDGEDINASDTDANVALARNGGTLTVSNGTLAKTGDGSNDDNCNFYGTNAIALVVGDGSTAIIDGSELTADSTGSNGVFATDSGTALVNDTTITTTADNSRGLDATYGGTILASAVTADTSGDHSATAATDRGGGAVSITDSTLTTAGSGSPLLYSTGDIQASGVTGTASGSQIAGMEGLNTILINDSTLESTNTGTTGSDPIANGVIIYQSTSGDAEAATGEHATFQAKDSTLTSAIGSGSMFYVTNTTADVVLSSTALDFDTSAATLLQASGNDANGWGQAGSNGAAVNFTGRDQTLAGDVVADTISTVNLYLLDGTTWTGAASITDNASAASGSTSDAPITVNVDGTSTWIVTDDTTISALNVADGGSVVDADGDTVTIIADGGTVVKGTGDVTVTVTGGYTTTVDETDDTQLSDDIVDRSAFDEQFGTSTAWSMA